MFCYKCGKEIESNFCGYCGANNAPSVSPVRTVAKNTSAVQGTFGQSGGSLSPYIPKKEKNRVAPCVFLVIHGAFLCVAIFLFDYLLNGSFEMDVLYKRLSLVNLMLCATYALIWIIALAVIRDFKVIIIALGCKWFVQILLDVIKYVIQYAYSEIYLFDEIGEFDIYDNIQTIVYSAVSTILACIIYNIVIKRISFKEKQKKIK